MPEFGYYSKKAIQLFKNPKHVGEIKNADGVGQMGNPVCILPEEKIHKNSELVNISKLKERENVLTHTGNYEKIVTTSSRKYRGKIVTLKNKLGKVSLTPEHLVHAIIVPSHTKFLRNKNKRNLIPAWYHSELLEEGDIILYPVLKTKKDIEHLDIHVSKSRWDFRSKDIPQKVPLDSDLLRLFGYFLSEGNIQDKPSKTFISFTLNIKEKEIAEDIKNLSKNLFGLDVKTKEIPERKASVVFLYSANLARFFKKLFGNGAKHKKIPDFIMNLPIEKQKSLIFGLWKGDGYVNLDRDGPRAGYSTISYQLSQQVKTLLLRQDIAPSIYEEKEREIGGVKHKKSYRIHVGQRESLKKLCEILKIKYEPKSYSSVDSWFDGNYLYTPITDRRMFDYNGRVNNLEVENSHSFVSEAFCLHNCGDVMKVYIKVGKNKNGKEVIKDIRYQTFGCLAAISASEALCILAKGKTLEDAKKITSKDIADFLEKIPPIKFHCSILGMETLRKAIDDYLSKRKIKT